MTPLTPVSISSISVHSNDRLQHYSKRAFLCWRPRSGIIDEILKNKGNRGFIMLLYKMACTQGTWCGHLGLLQQQPASTLSICPQTSAGCLSQILRRRRLSPGTRQTRYQNLSFNCSHSQYRLGRPLLRATDFLPARLPNLGARPFKGIGSASAQG
jgi:hypothetical protein